MPHKDPDQRRAHDKIRKRLSRGGSETTPAELARAMGVKSPAGLICDAIASGLNSTVLQSDQLEQLPDYWAMNIRQAALGQKLQRVAEAILESAIKGDDIAAADLDVARKLAADGQKIERIAVGLPAKAKGSEKRAQVLIKRLAKEPGAIEALHLLVNIGDAT